MKGKLVDEYIITTAPIILGDGIPLFKTNNPEIRLKLKSTRQFGEFVQNHYVNV
jgi:dihydrofolate reductase